MLIPLVDYLCLSCRTTFPSPFAIGADFAEFIMRSPGGHLAYLNSLEDPVFQRVADFVEHHKKVRPLGGGKRGVLVQRVFCVTCDPDPDGVLYEIGRPPSCPACGGPGLVTGKPSGGEVEVPWVRHERWGQLSPEHQLQWLDSTLRHVL